MVHSVIVGCAGKTVRSFENACHTWGPYRCVHDETQALYKSTFTFLCYLSIKWISYVIPMAKKTRGERTWLCP